MNRLASIPAILGITQQPDRRQSERRRVEIAAKIISQLLWCSEDCIIRDISKTGAKLEIPARLKLPASFNLVIPSKHSMRPVRCIWRRRQYLGVEFTGPPMKILPLMH